MLFLSPGIAVYFCTLIFVFGACMGSFLNCMAWRIVHGESVLQGRSHCDACGHVLCARDLVPVLSFALNRGKCRHCGRKLSSGHVGAELATAVSYVLLLLRFDISLQTLEMLVFSSLLLGCAFADLEGYIVPDGFILAGIFARVPFFFLIAGDSLTDALLGGFAVGGGLLALVLLYEKLRQVDAMGGGDIKLLFVTGLYLGLAKNLLCLFLACIFGICFALAAQGRTGDGDNPGAFPWGPSICAAAIVTALVGDPLIQAYLGLF